MAKVILICGNICSGKSTYSNKLKEEMNAVILSCDELMLAVFDEQLGHKHEEIVSKCNAYLYGLAEKIIHANTNVILDGAAWTKEGRKKTMDFFQSKNIVIEVHYIKVDEKTWKKQIEKRNRLVKEGNRGAYYVDENLQRKSLELFEEPDEEEVIVVNNSINLK